MRGIFRRFFKRGQSEGNQGGARAAGGGRRGGHGGITSVDVQGETLAIPCADTVFTVDFSRLSRVEGMKVVTPGLCSFKAILDEGREDKYVGGKLYNVTYVDDYPHFFEALQSEIGVLSGLVHPCITRFLGVFHDYPRVGLIAEFSSRSLSGLLSGPAKGRITWGKKVGILLGICRGLEYLHSQQIQHRALCPENILLHRETNEALVSGFMMTKFDDEQSQQRRAKKHGPCYQAPEFTTDQQETVKSDIFSLGVLMYQLLVEELVPFGDISSEVAFRVANDPTLRPQLPASFKVCTANVWWIDYMKRCWEHHSHRRPWIQDIVAVVEKEIGAGHI